MWYQWWAGNPKTLARAFAKRRGLRQRELCFARAPWLSAHPLPLGEQIRFKADFGDRRWTAMGFVTTNGNGSRASCRAAGKVSAARARITGSSSRSGGRWRDLPERLGDYRSVKRRYYRWIEMGVLDDMLETLAREADLEWLMIGSTIVRAHQHAAGARAGVKGGRMPKAWAVLAGA
jgi:transposase